MGCRCARIRTGVPCGLTCCGPSGSPAGDGVHRAVQRPSAGARCRRAVCAAGWLPGCAGRLPPERQGPNDVPVYEVTLRPEDGLYPLPVHGASGRTARPGRTTAPTRSRPPEHCPPAVLSGCLAHLRGDRPASASAIAGVGNLLSSRADFDFYRAAPPGGYKKGLPAAQRTDVGEGDIPPGDPGRGLLSLPALVALRRADRERPGPGDQHGPARPRRAASMRARSGWRAARTSRRRSTGSTC